MPKISPKALSTQHLLDIPSLSDYDITAILDLAGHYALQKQPDPVLTGCVLVSAFFEPSTRTRTSFAIAANRLGARLVTWDPEQSSLVKGETFMDTVMNIAAMAPDALIMRHKDFGAPGYVASRVNFPVINAGDSWRAHPTQALLDAFTMIRHKGALKGLRVAICGDVSHSRVAVDNMALLPRFGAQVRIVGPKLLWPKKLPLGVEAFEKLEDGIAGCDVVMVLRLQKERMQEGLIGSDSDYFHAYGLTEERLKCAQPDAIVMHPGPMNRGVEIADDVADHPTRSVIFEQPGNGVFVRMAVLDLLLNPKRHG